LVLETAIKMAMEKVPTTDALSGICSFENNNNHENKKKKKKTQGI